MKVLNLDTNNTLNMSICKGNHVPKSFLASAHRQDIYVDGRPALRLTNDGTVKYIVYVIDDFNFYSYDWTSVGSYNFATK